MADQDLRNMERQPEVDTLTDVERSDLPEGSFTIRWDDDYARGLGGYRVNIAGYDGGEVVPAAAYRGAVARAEAAEARVEELLAAESKAWREAETWKERAIESAEALRTLCQAVEGEERSGEMPTALVLSLKQARAVVAASTTGGQ